MAGEDRTVAIIGAVTTVLPSLIGLVQAVFVKQNPEAAPLTSAETVAGFLNACAGSLAVDDAWLGTHPKG